MNGLNSNLHKKTITSQTNQFQSTSNQFVCVDFRQYYQPISDLRYFEMIVPVYIKDTWILEDVVLLLSFFFLNFYRTTIYTSRIYRQIGLRKLHLNSSFWYRFVGTTLLQSIFHITEMSRSNKQKSCQQSENKILAWAR